MNNFYRFKRLGLPYQFGFTLIELLIVIGLLGLLAGWLAPNFVNSLRRGRDAQRRSDLKALELALQAYYTSNQTYPSSTDEQVLGIDWGLAFEHDGVTYMEALPEEPTSGSTYKYSSTGDQTYEAEACLEMSSGENVACSLFAAGECGSGRCYEIRVQ